MFSLKDTFFEKPQGKGRGDGRGGRFKLTHSPAVLRLMENFIFCAVLGKLLSELLEITQGEVHII